MFLGGDGVNESNPLETGETSAVGRALGMWGFGCYGTGIASAEEVLRVADRPDGSGPGGTGAEPSGAATAPGARRHPPAPPTAGDGSRRTSWRGSATRSGLRPGEVALRRAQAGSDEEAVVALAGSSPGTSGATRRRARRSSSTRRAWASTPPPYRAYLTARYELTDRGAPESALDDEQLREERERFVRRYQEPDTAAGFREQCARVLRSAAA